MSNIHSTAIIHSGAKLASNVQVGPYTVIEEGVHIGSGCKIGPHCHILGDTTIGADNTIHAGCVLGDLPQDLSYKGAATKLVIGKNNSFREHCTVHRGTKEGTSTEIGDHNFFMAHAHVAHNCRIGNHVIVVNSVLLGGYVEVEDHAFLGGGAVVHQFCRVGTMAILRGLARISKDVPPYCMAVENNELVGLNVLGMKRAGLTPEQRTKLKKAYSIYFLNGLNISQAAEQLGKEKISTPETNHLTDFIKKSKRGVCTARMKPTDLGEEKNPVEAEN